MDAARLLARLVFTEGEARRLKAVIKRNKEQLQAVTAEHRRLEAECHRRGLSLVQQQQPHGVEETHGQPAERARA